MTEPARGAEYRARKRLAALMAQPGAADRLDRAFARIDTDPDFAALATGKAIKGLKYSARQRDSGKEGGYAGAANMTRQQRQARSRKAGRAAFPDDPVAASARARAMNVRKARKHADMRAARRHLHARPSNVIAFRRPA